MIRISAGSDVSGVPSSGLQHSALDLARALGGDLHQRLGVVEVGLLEARVELGGVVGLGDADAGAAAGRLHEQRVAERVRALATPLGVGGPLAGGDRDAGQDRQPGLPEHHLHVGLVHADRAREHAGADVPDPGHLEHALDRAVLAPGAVQEREDDVDLAQGARRLGRLGDHEVGPVAVLGERDGRAVPVDRGELVGPLDLQPVRVAGLQDPAAVGGDADRHHVVRLPVDRLQDAPGGDARDRVLAGAAPEDDGDAGLAGGRVHRVDPIHLLSCA